MNKVKSVLFMAGISLALAFTFSCSSKDNENNNGNGTQGGCPDAVTNDSTVTCGGQTYKTAVIGSQVWMAENLNYAIEGSECYNNLESNCDIYGRLYNWETAMAVCPSGWHLPSDADWNELISYVESNSGCRGCASIHLKTNSGWNSNGNGEDTYDFSALPGGFGILEDGNFHNVGTRGYWWVSIASENNSNYAYSKFMHDEDNYVSDSSYPKYELLSVRCVKD